MKESIKNIIISISIIIIAILISLFFINNSNTSLNNKKSKGIGIGSRTININILDNKILCEDVILFNMHSREELKYKFFQEYDYLNNTKLYINNSDNFYSTSLKMDLLKGYINIDKRLLNGLKITDKNVSIKLTYELDLDYITRYTNTDVLPLYMDLENIDYLNNLTINLNSNYTITNLTVDNAEISKTKDGYAVNMNNINNSDDMNILFNMNTYLSNTINSDYVNPNILKETEDYDYINERIYILVIIITISVILLILSLIINNQKKTTNYRRDTSNLISPILAEAIIDGKIGLKELIMTTIVELNIRGNINIINNDTLELVSYDNLEIYEQSIVNLLFKNKTIKFSDINNTFANSNKSTIQFTQKMSLIKECLLEKIYSMNIFSKGLTFLNKAIGLCTILISINMPQILLNNSSSMKKFFFILSLLITFYYIKSNIGKKTIREEIITNNKRRTVIDIRIVFLLILTVFIIISTSISVAKYHIVFFMFTLLAICLNIYIAYHSQGIILTKEGKEEQLKLVELKNYINDYSLIRNRDLESVIIWDKYLAYATAFGIPNKITNSIYEEWYNLNINLQVVEKILS
ncbi:putative uncharacterized protein [Clostridium sp. CAG:567]|nr:putative uncharacterized protein [Clostridium sp. CAG:567]